MAVLGYPCPVDKLSVFDVWSSQASFERFGRTLMPILQELGIDPGQPTIMPVYSVIKPPAAKPKPKKRAPARAAGKKRGGKKR